MMSDCYLSTNKQIIIINIQNNLPKIPNSPDPIYVPIDSTYKKYEILSDTVTEYFGKFHESQFHIIDGNPISMIV